MPSLIPSIRRLYKFKIPSVYEKEVAKLPAAYQKFFAEWKLLQPQPVHYIPYEKEWKRDEETGEVKRLETVPIPVLYPPESHAGVWGGEGVVKGFQKRQRDKQRVPHFWFPQLIESVVHSEILGKRLSLTVTNRTISLIIHNHGFDNYILKTRACDLQSSLALKLKREMLMALYNRDLYPDDPIKAQEVFDKYKHYLDEYTKEEIDWYGWTVDEALQKWERESQVEPVPLKTRLRQELLSALAKPEEPPALEEQSRSWIQRINPFSKK